MKIKEIIFGLLLSFVVSMSAVAGSDSGGILAIVDDVSVVLETYRDEPNNSETRNELKKCVGEILDSHNVHAYLVSTNDRYSIANTQMWDSNFLVRIGMFVDADRMYHLAFRYGDGEIIMKDLNADDKDSN